MTIGLDGVTLRNVHDIATTSVSDINLRSSRRCVASAAEKYGTEHWTLYSFAVVAVVNPGCGHIILEPVSYCNK